MNGLRVLQSSEVENPTSKFMRIFMSGKKRLNPQKRKKKDIMKDIFLYGRGREMAQWRDLGK